MLFCPTCANLLALDKQAPVKFFCRTCPYIFKIKGQEQVTLINICEQKEVEDIFGGKEAWENVDQIDADCPKCSHKRAYYMQIQIRSADEPSTIFYKCVKCSAQWKEG